MKTLQHSPSSRRIFSALLTVLLSGAITVSAAAEYKPAAEAGWTLVFEDDFEREALGDGWVVTRGDFEVKNGHLAGSGVIFIEQGFPEEYPFGFQRLEFRVKATVAEMVMRLPGARPTVSDLSAVLHAQNDMSVRRPYGTGYMFQFGGNTNQLNRISRQRNTVVEDTNPELLITPSQYHDIAVENDRGTLRLWVDEKLLLEEQETFSLLGEDQNRVGLYLYSGGEVDSVRVYLKRLPDGYERD